MAETPAMATSPDAVPGKQRLAGIGFTDLGGAQRWLSSRELEGLDGARLLEGLKFSPSPDVALKNIVRILADRPEFSRRVEQGPGALSLYRLLGASEALGEFLLRRPEHLPVFDEDPAELRRAVRGSGPEAYREALHRAVGSDPGAAQPVAELTGDDAAVALRVAYRAQLTRIAIADVCTDEPVDFMPAVGAALADLAGAAVDAALAVARAELAEEEPGAADVALAVIGMGKCGARELNYVSDVDVIYVVGPAGAGPDGTAPDASGSTADADTTAPDEQTQNRIGTRLVKRISALINGLAPEPGLWEVDANLRPEGKDGPLVRTVESHRVYYSRWAANWEFQALMKARPIAGDPALGREYLEAIVPFVWEASGREGFVDSVQAMRHRVTDNIPAEERERQIKLGPGGLRDVEFTVQLLQLVHGRTDEQVRTRSTTDSLEALSERSFIGRGDAARFSREYRWLRLLEHRIQLLHLRRTHLMPAKEAEQLVVARGMKGPGEREKITPAAFLDSWRAVKRSVRGLHERLFFRPLLAAVAHLSAAEVALTSEAARDRLAALGYLDPKGAMRHIEALTRGLSRRSEIQRAILPVLLGWFADGVDPDAGLLGFRRVSEALGQTHWYLKMLRDSSVAAERLCSILSSSRFVTDLLEDEPESIAWLDRDDQLRPIGFEALWTEIRAKISRHTEADSAVRMVRLIRRREILRIAMGETSGLLTSEEIMRGLSHVDQVTVLGAQRAAEREMYSQQGQRPLTDLVIVGMGRQGGSEIGYGSDADVMFVHRPWKGADEREAAAQAGALISRIMQLLKMPTTPAIRAEKTLLIDADLRPEGKAGPLVRSLDSYAEYYERWADTWEFQALLRARPLSGSADLAESFVRLIDPYRYPAEFPEHRVREVRRVKARVEAERMPRGADPHRQLKLGRGGLSDVEWLVQLFQLRYAHEHPSLKTTSTLVALAEMVSCGLVAAEDAETLETAWRLATRIRGANVLRSGRASDSLPSSRRDLDATARWVGYGPDCAGQLEEDYLRITRRARAVYEKLFYGHLED
ncbi:bifunctional [glutamine synthetase] adenylyltransferase/[glutamine synthetase]-adenylyl-L-tyrosine phosphorylase [Rothia santali]|uniref:bifunctional [glutamine synthetase] adenylyltransferase/[glutamine synthetase]-adenylyl-L-tyrosine phosphorylase n=1 Tax=Rothia santali TaxID=2949643 RepID=UPI0026661B46